MRWGEGEYFVWFASYLTRNSPRDVWRDVVCCSLADLSSQSCGGLPTPPLSLINIDRKELQQRGEGEYSVYFPIVEPILTSRCFEVGRMQFPWPDPLSQSCRHLPPPPSDRYWWYLAAAARGCEYFICFVLHPTRTYLSSCDFGCRLPLARGNEGHWVLLYLLWLPLSHLNWKGDGTRGKFLGNFLCLCCPFDKTV
jgi:hypothetical protein